MDYNLSELSEEHLKHSQTPTKTYQEAPGVNLNQKNK